MKQLILFVAIQSDWSLKSGRSKEGEPINIGYWVRVNGMKQGKFDRGSLVGACRMQGSYHWLRGKSKPAR